MSPKPSADWVAWTLHLIFGSIIGAALGIYVAARVLRAGMVSSDGTIWAVAGCALIMGAASSHWGDRLWTRPSVFSGNEPPRSDLSALVSMVIAIVGVLAIVWGLLPPSPDTSVKVVAQEHSRHVHPLMFLIPGVFGGLLVMAWHARTIYLPWFEIDRDESPGLFWFAWGAGAVITLLMIFRIVNA
jgi:hypothetical protein